MSAVGRPGCRTPPTTEQQDLMFAYMLQQQEELFFSRETAKQFDEETHLAEQAMSSGEESSQSNSQELDDVDGFRAPNANKQVLKQIANVRKQNSDKEVEDENKEISDLSKTTNTRDTDSCKVLNDENTHNGPLTTSHSPPTNNRCPEVCDMFGSLSLKGSLGLEENGAVGITSAAPSRRRSIHNDSDDEQAKEIAELLGAGAINVEEAAQMNSNLEMQRGLDKAFKGTDDSDLRPFPFDKDGIPINWTQYRESRHNFLNTPAKIELHPAESEYDRIHKEMSDAGLDTIKVVRLQNVELLERFKMEIEHMKRRRRSDLDLNIKYLYHGTSVDESRICEEGLDQRLSRMGFFGKGIYFSDNPLKCVHYSGALDGQTHAYLLKCRVILGEQKCYPAGHHDTSLRREPEKANFTPGDWRFYDSVLGCPKDFNEYVIYENRRAMIEYIVWFKVNAKGNAELRGRPASPTFTKGDKADVQVTASVDEEEHFERISQVREAIRKKRCEEKGTLYIAPTDDKKKQDREMWIRLQKLHGVQPSSSFTTSQETKEENSSSTATAPNVFENDTVASTATVATSTPQPVRNKETNHDSTHFTRSSSVLEPDPVDQVMSSLISDFLGVTGTDDIELAKYYLEKCQMDVNQAIVTYYEEMP